MFELDGVRKSLLVGIFVLTGLVCVQSAQAQGPTPGQSVNMVSGITWPDGDPFLQRQNEPSIAVSTRNACHLLAGANDYRTVDLNFLATGETGDAWLGLFKSFDCGASWQSTLLPGYPLDKTPEGIGSPLKKWNAASDPVVRSGPSGFFGYSGIAFTRGTNQGQVFFSRFLDLNNKENGSAATGAVNTNADPIRYLGTSVIATGSARRFLDKPWMAIDIVRGGGGCTLQVPQPPPNGVVTQSVAVGNIYVAFTAFNYSQVGVLLSSQILFSRSSDCGTTWSTPIILTANDDDNDSLNQGPTIAIDPRTGFVYVAWRRFATANHRDAIVAVASISGGHWFTPAVPVITLPRFDPNHPLTGSNGPFSFFDQGTSGTSMRTNAYPSLAVADSGSQEIPGQIYLAWSQRGVGPNGEARIMMVASPTTLTWPKPFPIDNGPLSDDIGNSFARGHQFMPQLAFSGGKLVAVYYDQRIDHTRGFYTPNVPFQPDPSDGRLYKEDRVPEGELPANPGAVFTSFFDDWGLTQRRHTIEMMLSQAVPGPVPAFTPAVRVSQYIFGLRGDVSNPSQLQQLQENPPNLPLFANGSVPFFGDYIDVAPLMMVPTPSGGWIFNTDANPNQAPVFYVAWTSNQDVRPPVDGNWKHYTPVGAGGPSVFDPTQPRPNCVSGQEGMRNQNIYASRVTQGLLVSSPQTLKPLSPTLQRTFVVLVQNLTPANRTFHMTIANQPPGGFASFTAGINNPGAPVTPPLPVTAALDVDIPPYSGITRPVFAVSSSRLANITVNVVEKTPAPINSGLASFVAFNSDPSSPLTLLNPDGSTSGDVGIVEIYSPSTTDPTIFNPNAPNPNAPNPNGPNTGLSNPNAPNPNAPNPNAPNPNAPNPNAPNPNAPNPDLPNPNAPNPNAPNSVVPNPNAPNPNAPNPNAPNTNITNASIFDAAYTVTNLGNTTGSYHVKLVGNNPGNIPLQLTVNKTYQTPTSSSYENPTGPASCQLTTENHNNVQTLINNPPIVSPVNLNDPGIQDPSSGNATFALFPGETAVLVLRGYFSSYNDAGAAFSAFKSLVTQIAPVVVPQAANTNTNTIVVSAPMFITTSALPDAIVGTPYSTTLNAIGGTPPYTWSTPSGGLSPAVLNPSTGVISFTPATTGLVNFVSQVKDSSNPQRTATRSLTINLVQPLAVTTASPLANAAQGASYGPIALSAAGGTPPYAWTLVAVNGVSLNSRGVLSGTPAAAGTFNFTATVSDGGSPGQTASQLMTLNVLNPFALTFITQPTSTIGGTAISPAVTVRALDNSGAVVPGINVTLTIQNNPSNGTLFGTTTTMTNEVGVATFSGLRIDRGASAAGCHGSGYTLLATAPGGANATSNCFGITGFAPTGSAPANSLAAARISPTATLLNNGKVLVTGGTIGGVISDATTLSTAEVYDPAAKTFASTGNMNAHRYGHTATLLPNGKVLIVGGASTQAAEIYDPATGIFTSTGSTNFPRSFHTATLLNDGTVLIAGGSNTMAAEIYNPATGVFTVTGNMTTLRTFHTATPLNNCCTLTGNGLVLISGGSGSSGTLNTSEYYDPETKTFTFSSTLLASAREIHTATLINANVYVIGGTPDGLNGLASADSFNSSALNALVSPWLFEGFNTFGVTQQVGGPPTAATFTLNSTAWISEIETYHFNNGNGDVPGTITLQASGGGIFGPFPAQGFSSASTLSNPGTAFIASVNLPIGPGTFTVQDSVPDTWSFNNASNNRGFIRVTGTFTPPQLSGLIPTLNVARAYHTTTLLPSGSVLVAGGQGGAATPNLASAEIFNPGTDSNPSFSSTGSLVTARRSHATVLLPDGTVFVVGGNGNSGPLSSAEIYYPF